MTIYRKTSLIITLTLCGLFIALYFIISATMLGGFLTAERLEIEQRIKRIDKSLSRYVDEFAAKVSDWAFWDDTYAFIQDGNRRYVESNLTYEAFDLMRINALAFVNSTDEIVWSGEIDAASRSIKPLCPSIKKHVMPESGLLKHSDIKEFKKGFLLIDGKAAIVASLTISDSKASAPARGSLIFMRYLNDEEMSKINELLSTRIEFFALNDKNMPADFKAASSGIFYSNSPSLPQTFVSELSSDTVKGYFFVNDVFNVPMIIVGASFPRIIYCQGPIALKYFLAAVVIVGLIFGFLAVGLLDAFVIRRLKTLARVVKEITIAGDFSKRIDPEGNDEVSVLTFEIDGMLASIEKYRNELDEAMAGLDRASRAKSDFLANMSHEIRTPMTSVIGYADLLNATQLNEDQADYLRRIQVSSRILLSTINDILDYSMIETGELELDRVEFNVDGALGEVIEVANAVAIQKGMTLEYSIASELKDTSFTGDAQRFKQIVLNLLGNAIKFSVRGKITVNVEFDGMADGFAAVRVSISDEGIGIPFEKQKEIFLPFVQGDVSSTRKYGGTGLGLTISNQLVKMMGGERIFLESSEGKGARFYFTVKFEKNIADKA